jgi:uncharacterized protein YlxW (UPF0749 family)
MSTGRGTGPRPGEGDPAGTPPEGTPPEGTPPEGTVAEETATQPTAARHDPAAEEAAADDGGADDAADDDAADEDAADEATADEDPVAGETAADGPAADGATPVPERVPLRQRSRDPLAAVLIGILTLLLGFAFAVQVRSTDTDDQLAGAREEDLVRILDDLTAQEDRLRQEIADQRAALDQLGSSDSAAAAALEEAQQRAEALGILNGTVAAQGPGITMTIRDPEGRITASVLLNAIQELRGAGAETMQVDDVRVGVSTAVTGGAGALRIDGTPVQAPYTFVVIGSGQDMATAMSIPGGVVSTVGGRGGSVDIVQSDLVVVDALRPLDEPQYADPDDGD